jgi:hypothetical protein
MKKQLEQMQVELREMMIYNAPPELGALWTDVSEMMKSMGVEQKFLLKKKLRDEERAAARKREKFKLYMTELSYGGFVIVLGLTMTLLMAYISYDRKQRWPELEPEVIKQHQAERRRLHLLELQQYEEQLQKEDAELQQQSR